MSTTEKYQAANNALIESFLERTFYSGWRDPTVERLQNFRGLEIMMNYNCNLACRYCYVNRYGEELYPSELYEDEDKLLDNLDIIIDWLLENKFKPKIEFFTGEALVQRVAFEALHKLLDRLGGHIPIIVIPTNYTFILSEALTTNVEELLIKGEDVGTRVVLSASFDGKYCEGQRPFRHNVDYTKTFQDPSTAWKWAYKGIPDKRDDAYYDRCFAFAKKHSFGFHPMIGPDFIHNWIKNFDWFQEMFKKYDIPWYNVYLLEVRNPEWTKAQCNDLTKFMRYLVNWVFNGPAERNPNKWMQLIFGRKGFNILSNPLTRTGRGMGCSFQSDIYLRLGDLSVVPCHRTSYEQFILGKYIVKDGRIDHFKVQNPELFISGISTYAKDWPYCEQCMIRNLCSQGCQGAQVETTGDLYTPIPTMCRMEHAKIKGMLLGYQDCGVFKGILTRIVPSKAEELRAFDRTLTEVKANKNNR